MDNQNRERMITTLINSRKRLFGPFLIFNFNASNPMSFVSEQVRYFDIQRTVHCDIFL